MCEIAGQVNNSEKNSIYVIDYSRVLVQLWDIKWVPHHRAPLSLTEHHFTLHTGTNIRDWHIMRTNPL